MADALDLLDFLKRLRERWRVWLLAALAGASIGGGVMLLRPLRYVAQTQLLIETPPSATGIFMMMSPAYLDSLETYVTIAESPTVRSRALESLSEGHRAAAGSIDAEIPPLNRLMVVRADGRDPESALALARAAAEQTLRMVEGLQPSDSSQAGNLERLLLIDPGIPPTRPEGRNVAGNAMAAAFFALAAGALYESVRYFVERSGRDA